MDGEEPIRSGEELSHVSLFDYSVENHLKVMNSIADLCGEVGTDFDEDEIKRLSSSVTFLREWRHFNYESRTIRFHEEMNSITEAKDITLPQFSSASVPKGKIHSVSSSEELSEDFVMYVGGSVWALDWCPRVHKITDARAKCEFLAVAAHPPESYTHKIGVSLTGRGMIQIWCILNASREKDIVSSPEKNKKRKSQSAASIAGKSSERQRKESLDESLETSCKKPRGRPRKNPIETMETKKPRGRPRKQTSNEYIQPLAVRYPEESGPLAVEASSETLQVNSKTKKKDGNAGSSKVSSSRNLNSKLPVRRKRSKTAKSDIDEAESHQNSDQDKNPLEISDEITLPKVILCMAHNGKVVWDMKWRPSSLDDSQSKHIMGYLAVLLGNGSLEVWEIPMPQAMEAIYLSSSKSETDPRFVKLTPIFKCSKLRCGDTQSIPLSTEWSTSENPDLLLAGCHDGSVAIWKFSTTKSLEDTEPLLFFSADTSPIRSVAWAPSESDPENANLIATAGHGGLKFWDIRDPFRPLWDLHPVPRFIYSINWLSDPRCVLLSYDDGTIRIVSLMKAACDVAATGKAFTGTKQQGLSVYNCSSSPIWNVQVSPLTGLAAYCSADGAIVQFQLSTKSVEKDSRYRTPHFLCGSLTVEKSTFTVHTPLPNSPVMLKKPVKDSGENPRCLRSLLNQSNNKFISPVSDARPLALAYGEEDGEIEMESERVRCSLQTGNSTKEAVEREEVVGEEGGREGKEKTGNEREGLGDKLVGMQRVRWNMNKGSDRWLSYGGAAGIVRCHQVALPQVFSPKWKR